MSKNCRAKRDPERWGDNQLDNQSPCVNIDTCSNLIMSQAMSSQSEKSTQAHHEDIPKECQKDAHSKTDDHDTFGLVKSRFDELSVPRTV